jgi:hypothetical protein
MRICTYYVTDSLIFLAVFINHHGCLVQTLVTQVSSEVSITTFYSRVEQAMGQLHRRQRGTETV